MIRLLVSGAVLLLASCLYQATPSFRWTFIACTSLSCWHLMIVFSINTFPSLPISRNGNCSEETAFNSTNCNQIKNFINIESNHQVNIANSCFNLFDQMELFTSFRETMAEAKPEDMTLVECGFCCSNNEDLQDPRSLPCSHVHCFGCVTSFYETHNIVQCPLQFCRLVA